MMEKSIDRKLAARYIFREIMGLVFMGVALFWSAGRVNWWQGWAVLALMAAWIVATATVIFRVNPGLLAERLGPRKGARSWDTAIMSLLGLAQLARYIVAGLDQRYSWTEAWALWVQLAALVVSILSYAVVVWATAANAFFSQIVRLQPERGQTVAIGGPYRFVRHPAYLGALVFELAAPVLLVSGWAFIPSALSALLLIVRTALEDRMLQAELAGYADYAGKVRYRLLPGIW